MILTNRRVFVYFGTKYQDYLEPACFLHTEDVFLDLHDIHHKGFDSKCLLNINSKSLSFFPHCTGQPTNWEHINTAQKI